MVNNFIETPTWLSQSALNAIKQYVIKHKIIGILYFNINTIDSNFRYL